MPIELISRRKDLDGVRLVPDSNAGLWLDRYSEKVGAKGGIAQTIETVAKSVKIPSEYKLHFNRWKSELEKKEQVKIAKATVQGRMVVGLGAESILETAITLHRTYGVPFIPGSALKGLASAAAHRFLANDEWRKKHKDKDGKVIEQGASHEVLFGNTKTAGFVTFHDALLIPEGDQIPLDLDVMTVHHRDYYGTGKAPPADWDSPNPVSFVTARGTYLLALEGPPKWVLAAMDILAEALREEGIGAKTAAGYGRMIVTGHQTAEERAKAEANEKKRLEEEQRALKDKIENLKKRLNMGNARVDVPAMLRDSPDADRMELANWIIGKLTVKSLKAKRDQPWVQALYSAAELPLP